MCADYLLRICRSETEETRSLQKDRQTLKLLSDFLHFTPQEVQNIELYGKDKQMATILPTTEALAAHAL